MEVGLIALWKPASVLLYALLEYWLGKTEKVKGGSVLEVLAGLAKKVLKPEDAPK